MVKYNLKLVDSKNIYGTMNGGTMRLSNITEFDKKMLASIHSLNIEDLNDYELTKDDKRVIFNSHRLAFGKENGFDWRKMFMADQKTKDGSYFEITRDYVEANPNGWTDIDEDILIVTDKVPGVVIGHPVSDCPVVIMQDMKQNICAIAHCSAALTDKKMPMMIADALLEAYESKDEDIVAYVSACAGTDWVYDVYPNWATDKEMWKTGIEEDENGIFHINLRKVIKEQLRKRNISNIHFNMDDTITNPNYYSHHASSPDGLNDQTKYGRNFAGAFYKVKK